MRKILTTVFLLVIISLVMVSCGKSEAEKNMVKGVNVAFVYLGPIGDGGWNYAHNKGKLEVEELPFVNNVYYQENANNSQKTEEAIEEFVNQGAQLIFTNSVVHKEATLKMANKYPKVKFENCSSFIKSKNCGSYFGKIYQAWYLAGVTAGLKTVSKKIGFVSAFPSNECMRIANAFALGVKKINPEVKIYLEWTNNWFDSGQENIIVNKMIDMGCDIICNNTDSSESQRVADNRGAYSIGYSNDMKDFAPQKNLVNVVWNWGVHYKQSVRKVYKGSWKAENVWEDIDSGLFGLTEYTEHIFENEREIINRYSEELYHKEEKIFVGEIYDNKGLLRVKKDEKLSDTQLLAIDWLVENIEVLNSLDY